MFQAIRALTGQKNSQNKNLNKNSCKTKVFSRFLSNALIETVLQEKIQPYTLHAIIRTALNISFKENDLSSIKFKEIMRFRKLWQMKVETGSYKE